MTDSYLGEIQAFGFGFCPVNWMPCNGAVLPLRQFTALFSLIGTYYGGDGKTTFALPNLVGHVAISQGQGPGLNPYSIGETTGETSVTLLTSEMPMHTHGLQLASAPSSTATPGPSATSNVVINPGFNGFVSPPSTTMFASNGVIPTGNSQPHPNAQPTLAMIYCICVNGIFPSFSTS